ncbi:MAG: thiol:disulfide interchange protein DsbA/DsbL [Wenzhouxiangella sp.]
MVIAASLILALNPVMANEQGEDESEGFMAGYHYVMLDSPVPTAAPDRIEVIAAFSYGCPYCFDLEPHVMAWESQQKGDVDFQRMHAVWNDTMRFYAQVYYSVINMGITDAVHIPIFNTIHVKQQPLVRPRAVVEFMVGAGFDEQEFMQHFRSPETQEAVETAARRVEQYSLSGVPQFVVNGKYRVDPVRADGRRAMLDVVDYLVEKERALLAAKSVAELTE